LICLIEIEKGKQFQTLIDNNYKYYDIDTKYGEKSILRNMPLFRNKSNAFISRHNLVYKKYFLKNGTKKLMYEINLSNNIKLAVVEFDLDKPKEAKRHFV